MFLIKAFLINHTECSSTSIIMIIAIRNICTILSCQEKVRRVAERIKDEETKKDTLEKEENRRISEEKSLQQQERVDKILNFMKTRGDERYYQLRKGYLLSEVQYYVIRCKSLQIVLETVRREQ